MSPGRQDQDQTAGDYSQQQQAGGNIINVMHAGISASDVIEITRSETKRVIEQEFGPVAERIAEERIGRLGDKIIERFAQDPGLRKAFADPDFVWSLQDAGRAAASNDDYHTEDLLVDLLANRAEQGNSARLRLTTSHAIRAADKLSVEALRGLTAYWAVAELGPPVPSALSHIYARVPVAAILRGLGLEAGHGWVEDLDALGLARLVTGIAISRKPLKQGVREMAAPYLNPGIDQEANRDLIDSIAAEYKWLPSLLTPHPLKPGFVVLAGADVIKFRAQIPDDAPVPEAVEQLISQNGFGQQDQTAVARFDEIFDQSEHLVGLAEWWDSLPMFSLTLVGRAIGLVNARRHITFTGFQTIAQMLERSETTSGS